MMMNNILEKKNQRWTKFYLNQKNTNDAKKSWNLVLLRLILFESVLGKTEKKGLLTTWK